MTDEPKASRQGQERSPNYPYIPLEKAIERARLFLKEEKNPKAVVPPHIAVKHWGYSEKSSGGKQTLAALRSFGLMEKVGDGVRLSERARKFLLLDEREHTAERRVLLKEAALAPAIHQKLWDKYGSQLPSDASLKYALQMEFNFAVQAVADFIREYRDTIAYAGLDSSAIIEEEEEVGSPAPSTLAVGDYVNWESQGVLQNAQPLRLTAFSEDGSYAFVEGSGTGLPVSQLTRVEGAERTSMVNTPVPTKPAPQPGGAVTFLPLASGFKQDVFSLDEGDVVLRWPAGLSQESYEDVKGWLEVVLRKVARSVGIPASRAASLNPSDTEND